MEETEELYFLYAPIGQKKSYSTGSKDENVPNHALKPPSNVELLKMYVKNKKVAKLQQQLENGKKYEIFLDIRYRIDNLEKKHTLQVPQYPILGEIDGRLF